MARMKDQEIINWVMACREEADDAKRDRMRLNDQNYDMFHLKHNFSHKQEGQSREILSKTQMAVETIKSFFQQALADQGDWWKMESRFPVDDRNFVIRPHEATKLTNHFMERGKYFSHTGNSIQQALLGSLAISKVFSKLESKPRFVSKKKGRGRNTKRWIEEVENKELDLVFKSIGHDDFYPDPTGNKMYVIEDMWLDVYEVQRMAEGPDAIFDSKAVAGLNGGDSEHSEHESDRARQTGQNTTKSGHRPKIKLTEYWGNIINSKTGELEHENIVCTIANDSVLVRKPTENPLWHRKNPYVFSPLFEVANSVWHRAPMDAATQHNRALIELYNLMVDATLKQVHGISQLRKDMLDNPAQVSNGIKPGDTLVVNSALPIGGKVLEPLTAVTLPGEAFNVFNLMNQEFNASALTNDLRQGVLPFRQVKATEVVEASQTITSVFQGLAKNFEVNQVLRELEIGWFTVAQNWDKISQETFMSLFGKERGDELFRLTPQDVFTETANGMLFRVFGVTMALSKQTDFTKHTTLLQTVAGAPPLLEAFVSKYDLTMMLEEIMTSLDIDKHKLEIPQAVQKTMQGPEPGGEPEQGPDQQSQVPQADSGSLADLFGGPQVPSAEFPGSPATGGQGDQ